MDEVELLFPGPLFGDVVDFEDAVWWHPLLGWRVQIDAADDEVRILLGDVNCPVALPSANVEHVLCVLGDWRAEERVSLLGVEDAHRQVACLHHLNYFVSDGVTYEDDCQTIARRTLLIVRGSPVFLLPGITSSILDVSLVNGGLDRGGVTELTLA